MMTDVDARQRLADAIEAYLDRRIDNGILDNTLCDKEIMSSPTCLEIAGEMGFFLSDFCYHKNEEKHQVAEEVEQAIRRWVCLLRGGWEWPPNRKDATHFGLRGLFDLLRSNFCLKSRLGGNLYWPLSGRQEWDTWYSVSIKKRSPTPTDHPNAPLSPPSNGGCPGPTDLYNRTGGEENTAQ